MRAVFEGGESLDRRTPAGRLVLDGSRPFLLVVRQRREADPVAQLVAGEASWLVADAAAEPSAVRALVHEVVDAGVAAHGSFLVVELWEGAARFRVLGPDGPAPATVRTMAVGLEELDVGRRREPVEVEATDERHPPGLPPLLTVHESHAAGALLVGVAVPPLYRDPDTGALYPVFLRRLAHGLSRVLRRAVFEFVRVQTGAQLSSYRALGRRRLGPAVWEVDRSLAHISASFDSLLLVAPVNPEEAWHRFRHDAFERAPEFHYRLLPLDPDLVKRRLYELRVEEVEDPAVWRLLREKRDELDREVSLVDDRNTPAFLHSSIRLFGHPDAALRQQATEILERVPPSSPSSSEGAVGAEEFAAVARQEFAAYRRAYPEFRSEAQVRPDVSGLMVSSGKLLVGRALALAPARVDALLQHEVGTHVLTYVNGAAQPFQQLRQGLAGYDGFQEGLGVLAEYLVGGLTPARLRHLAGRVVAVSELLDGAGFVDGFRSLHRDHGFPPRSAFDLIARVHTAGGFTRDMIYLRGFSEVVAHLRAGGELEPLYVGKIAPAHLEILQELRERGVLHAVPLLPRFLERPSVRERLDALRAGIPMHAMAGSGGDGR